MKGITNLKGYVGKTIKNIYIEEKRGLICTSAKIIIEFTDGTEGKILVGDYNV